MPLALPGEAEETAAEPGAGSAGLEALVFSVGARGPRDAFAGVAGGALRGCLGACLATARRCDERAARRWACVCAWAPVRAAATSGAASAQAQAASNTSASLADRPGEIRRRRSLRW